MPVLLSPSVLTVTLLISTSSNASREDADAELSPVVVAVPLKIWTKPLNDVPLTAGLLLPAVVEVTPNDHRARPDADVLDGPARRPATRRRRRRCVVVRRRRRLSELPWTTMMPLELSPSVVTEPEVTRDPGRRHKRRCRCCRRPPSRPCPR